MWTYWHMIIYVWMYRYKMIYKLHIYINYICGRIRFRCCFLPLAVVSGSPAEVALRGHGSYQPDSVSSIGVTPRNALELADPPNIEEIDLLLTCIWHVFTHFTLYTLT